MEEYIRKLVSALFIVFIKKIVPVFFIALSGSIGLGLLTDFRGTYEKLSEFSHGIVIVFLPYIGLSLVIASTYAAVLFFKKRNTEKEKAEKEKVLTSIEDITDVLYRSCQGDIPNNRKRIIKARIAIVKLGKYGFSCTNLVVSRDGKAKVELQNWSSFEELAEIVREYGVDAALKEEKYMRENVT